MKVCFYAGRLQFDGDFLTKRGLGGSESALINLTSKWKRYFPDDEIIVYSGIYKRENTNFEGVIYKTLLDFISEYRFEKYDAFISLRDFEPFTLKYINSSIKCLWSEDDMNEIGLIQLRQNMYATENVDCIFGVSEYACNEIKKAFPNKKIFLQRNGYNEDWIPPECNSTILEDHLEIMKEKEKNHICIYTSTPFRGLDVLSDVWQEIYNKCYEQYNIKPILNIFSGMSLYNRDDKDFYNLYQKLSSLPNVNMNKPIPQKELYKELLKAKLFIYPNHFLETSCMSVLEAIANRTWILTTNLGALSEQVKNGQNGYTINGNSMTNEYQEQFIKLAVKYICEPCYPNNDGLIFSWGEQALLMRNRIKEMI